MLTSDENQTASRNAPVCGRPLQSQEEIFTFTFFKGVCLVWSNFVSIRFIIVIMELTGAWISAGHPKSSGRVSVSSVVFCEVSHQQTDSTSSFAWPFPFVINIRVMIIVTFSIKGNGEEKLKSIIMISMRRPCARSVVLINDPLTRVGMGRIEDNMIIYMSDTHTLHSWQNIHPCWISQTVYKPRFAVSKNTTQHNIQCNTDTSVSRIKITVTDPWLTAPMYTTPKSGKSDRILATVSTQIRCRRTYWQYKHLLIVITRFRCSTFLNIE